MLSFYLILCNCKNSGISVELFSKIDVLNKTRDRAPAMSMNTNRINLIFSDLGVCGSNYGSVVSCRVV